ncbi:unnamed protein product [Rodentolepis nana]|uniref:Uncharacterized protein n=1 Tax=Rodentolepis nana TaxID=102285 RepID=A0A0R3TMB1_RODNA|nr:unnamed protein product [Rodentolepis nana]
MNIGGKEIEYMLNNSHLELIYSNEATAKYQHYNGTRTTLDILLASSHDLGSGHKPVTANIAIDCQSMTTKVST